MALESEGDGGTPNSFIMLKAGSPFLKRWMQFYSDVEEKQNWEDLSARTPYEMYQEKDPDLTVLNGDLWFCPPSSKEDSETTLKIWWFGKSWHDIEKSYGTHFWYPTEEFAKLFTPKVVRMIDPPLFCKLRKLFDNLVGDGYYSTPQDKNVNCTIAWTSDLKENDHRIFSDYKMATDDLDMK